MKEFRSTPICKNHWIDTAPYILQTKENPKGHLLRNKGPLPWNRDYESGELVMKSQRCYMSGCGGV